MYTYFHPFASHSDPMTEVAKNVGDIYGNQAVRDAGKIAQFSV